MSFVLSMARWMGFKTIAEGVEKKDEVDFLRSIGCDLIQGFYFAKPMPSDDFKSYMMSHNKIRTVGTKKEKIGSGVNPEKKYSILVIDDSKFNQEYVRKVISVRYNLLFASNGVEGMQILEKSGDQISLIMLDLMMPVMDGFQFLTKYTKMDFYNRIPVIVMSESGSKSEALALSLGAEDYIAKPFSPEVMMLRVDKAFSHIRRESKE
jgi:PleD family two-component response regulator